MAGVPDSTPPAPPARVAHQPRYVVTHNGAHVSVEVDGVPVRRLVDVNVRFGLHEFPVLELTIGMPDVRVAIDDAIVTVDAVDLPEPVARALYHHLQQRFGSRGD